MNRVIIGLLCPWFSFVAIFTSENAAKTAFQNSNQDNGRWMGVGERGFKECSDNEVVVGMCSSQGKETCRYNDVPSPHGIKCRKFDTYLYSQTKVVSVIEGKEVARIHTTSSASASRRSRNASKTKIRLCPNWNTFIGGFCLSQGKDAECYSDSVGEKFFYRAECRSGYEETKEFEDFKDVCGDYGQNVECPRDDGNGPWAAVGICRGLNWECKDFNCPHSPQKYGLRCKRLKKKDPPPPPSSSPPPSPSPPPPVNVIPIADELPSPSPPSPAAATEEEPKENLPSVLATTGEEASKELEQKGDLVDHSKNAGNLSPKPNTPVFDSIFDTSTTNLGSNLTPTPHDKVAKVADDLKKKTESSGVEDTKASCYIIFAVTASLLFLAFNE